MQANRFEGVHVAMLVTDDFEQVELTEPRKALNQAGAKTVLVSPNAKQVTGMNHDVKRDTLSRSASVERSEGTTEEAWSVPYCEG